MFELIVQDFIDAWSKLDRERFCKQIGVPLLIAKGSGEGLVFQSDATQFVPSSSVNGKDSTTIELSHKLPVLEIRQTQPGPSHQVRIGRSEENDLVIVDETVSSYHAVIHHRAQPEINKLEDLESTNGTSVNGTVLVPGRAVPLQNGNVVAFGDAEFLFFTPGGLYDEFVRLFKDKPPSRS